MKNKLVIGGIYRHFKGNYYLLEAICKNANSEKEMVLYRTLYDDGSLWVRDLDEFIGLVDKEKYPYIKQKYRFEYIEVKKD